MQAASQTAEISYREYTITEVISELADVVEAQLEAARSLDAAGLTAATARRQDLLFHLQVAMVELRAAPQGARASLDPEDQLNLRRISALDQRLKVVLGSVSSCLSSVLGRSNPDVYGCNGRIKG